MSDEPQILQTREIVAGEIFCLIHGIQPMVRSVDGKPVAVSSGRDTHVEYDRTAGAYVSVPNFVLEHGDCAGCWAELHGGDFVECPVHGIQPRGAGGGCAVGESLPGTCTQRPVAQGSVVLPGWAGESAPERPGDAGGTVPADGVDGAAGVPAAPLLEPHPVADRGADGGSPAGTAGGVSGASGDGGGGSAGQPEGHPQAAGAAQRPVPEGLAKRGVQPMWWPGPRVPVEEVPDVGIAEIVTRGDEGPGRFQADLAAPAEKAP